MNANSRREVGEIINPVEEEFVGSHVVAEKLKIAESTVRKHSGMLKNAGYIFQTDSSGDRIYRPDDIRAFSEIQRLKASGLKLPAAVQVVASMQEKDGSVPDLTPDVLQSAREKMQSDAFAQMQKKFLEQTQNMKDEILREFKNSLPSPEVIEENERLKKELSDIRIQMIKTNELLEKMTQGSEEGSQNSDTSIIKKGGWLSKLLGKA